LNSKLGVRYARSLRRILTPIPNSPVPIKASDPGSGTLLILMISGFGLRVMQTI
jgi:hypothetical protein